MGITARGLLPHQGSVRQRTEHPRSVRARLRPRGSGNKCDILREPLGAEARAYEMPMDRGLLPVSVKL